METKSVNFITKERFFTLLAFIIGHGILFILKIIFKPYINTINTMIDFLINNFGLIISISAIVISVALIVYWKIKDLITEYKATIQRLYNGVYAANLMLSVHSLLLVKNENNKQLLRLSTDEI